MLVEFVQYDRESDSSPYEIAGQKMLEIINKLKEEEFKLSDILILLKQS
jgi:hypothetical protein